jgi:hypothetical protein
MQFPQKPDRGNGGIHCQPEKNLIKRFSMLAGDIRFKSSYRLKLNLCKNPKTPQKIVLSLLKYLRIFDLGDITKDRIFRYL